MKQQHNITKIILKNSTVRDYYCNNHNTSYPTLQSLKESHPNLDKSKIIPFYKNGHGVYAPQLESDNIPDQRNESI